MQLRETFERALEAVRARKSSNGYIGFCPAHNDRNNPSLGISLTSDGTKILTNCFTGCDHESVKNAMRNTHGIDLSSSAPVRIQKPKSDLKKVAEYIYQTSDGADALRIDRLEGHGRKTFRQYRKEGEQWAVGAPKGVELCPYKFHDWKELSPLTWIYLVEGEKCAEHLLALGVKATTTPGGASGWREYFAKAFKDRSVVILPDNDEPGRKYAASVLKDIRTIAASVKVIHLPNLKSGEDVADWIDKGGSLAELAQFTACADDTSSMLESESQLKSKALADFEAKEINWLWKDRIPLGCISILEGDGGVGKSFIMASLASAISTGRHLPEDNAEREPRSVLLLASEDDPAIVLRPRFEAHCADLKKVRCYDQSMLLDQAGLSALEKEIEIHNSILVVIDPIQAFMQGLDSSSQGDVRSLITPLSEMARRRFCSVVLVRHWNKATQTSARYRGNGSVDFRNGARSVLQVLKNNEGQHFVAHDKSNYSPTAPSLTFSIQENIVEWGGVTDLTADDILATMAPGSSGGTKPNKLEAAKDLILSSLSNGKVLSTEMMARAAEAKISIPTLNRAKSMLGVKSPKAGLHYFWELPDHDDHHQASNSDDDHHHVNQSGGAN